ncbi:unnamed protein product, partial [Staurois parvus]
MYVKWFDTVMFYYVIFVNLVNITFKFFKFPTVPSPYAPTSQGTEHGRQMPASARGHCRGPYRRDIAGAKDKVSEEEMPEQRCRVFPSVARGKVSAPQAVTPRYTREYLAALLFCT